MDCCQKKAECSEKNDDCSQKKEECSEKKVVCCPEGSAGALGTCTEGTGKETKIEGLTVYEVGSGDRVIIIVHDVYGLQAGHGKANADRFAKAGFKVYYPDLCHGEPFPEDGKFDHTFVEWCKKFPYSKIGPSLKDILIPHAKANGAKSIGVTGYCWGFWAMTQLCAESADVLAAVHVHPSPPIFKILGQEMLPFAEKIDAAQLFLPVDADDASIKKDGEYYLALKKRLGDKVENYEFPGEVHGFMSRGDLSVKKTKESIDKAFELSIEFFNKHL